MRQEVPFAAYTADAARAEKKTTLQVIGIVLAVAVVLVLGFYRLTDYPTTWFDEGSHLHVPKTLVRFGVYADYSSEGFRHYGPTIGVGPTVMLPVAAAFQLFGIGLLQARVVMVIYLLAAIYAFFTLGRIVGNQRLAWIATALFATSQGVSLFEYGRQLLGEVPGLFFVLAGFALWYTTWQKPSWLRLIGAGLLLGMAMVTKHQYLLLLAPTLGLGWLLNWFYYRVTPHRVFLVPGIISATCFAAWQLYLIFYLGPATASENLAMFREFTGGAALVFSRDLMELAVKELLNWQVYLGLLLPALLYGFFLSLPRTRSGQQWGLLWLMVTVNLVWYVVASIGWVRYAFPGLAVSAFFVARLFVDLIDNVRLNAEKGTAQTAWSNRALGWALSLYLLLMIALPLAQTALAVARPAFNAPAAMAAYLDQNVPEDALIETWEPEMGFLTNHNYHFPPPLLLNDAVGHIWLGRPSPNASYDFVQTAQPAYVLVGAFSQYVGLYGPEILGDAYAPVTQIGAYQLYQRVDP